MKTPVTRKQITATPFYQSFQMEWIFHTSVRDQDGRLIMLGLTFWRRS